MGDRYQPRDLTGRFAFSKAGHDKGQLYVVVSQEDGCVGLCDGRLKTIDAPKRKNLKHIQPVNAAVEEELLERLLGGGIVRDEEIRLRIKRYLGAAEEN